jgi:hypothetical protein
VATTRSQSRNARAYGAHLANCFGKPEPPTHVRRTLQRGVLAVSELQFNSPVLEPSASIGYDDAFLVSVFIRNLLDHEFWHNGQSVGVEAFRSTRPDMTHLTCAQTQTLLDWVVASGKSLTTIYRARACGPSLRPRTASGTLLTCERGRNTRGREGDANRADAGEDRRLLAQAFSWGNCWNGLPRSTSSKLAAAQ